MTLKLSNSPFMVVSTTTNCTTTRDKTVLGKKFFFLIKLNLQQSLYFVRIFCLPVKRFTAVVYVSHSLPCIPSKKQIVQVGCFYPFQTTMGKFYIKMVLVSKQFHMKSCP